jgi:hypothetical protein
MYVCIHICMSELKFMALFNFVTLYGSITYTSPSSICRMSMLMYLCNWKRGYITANSDIVTVTTTTKNNNNNSSNKSSS